MILSHKTGSRHSQMIAAGRGVIPTQKDIEMCHDLIEAKAISNILSSVRLILASGQLKNHTDKLVDRYHIEAVRFAHFNMQLDAKNVNFKMEMA